jgi:hypothetical protein
MLRYISPQDIYKHWVPQYTPNIFCLYFLTELFYLVLQEAASGDWHQLSHANGEGPHPWDSRLSVAEVQEKIADMDAIPVLNLFSDLARDGRLDEALDVVEAAVRAKRDDILGR